MKKRLFQDQPVLCIDIGLSSIKVRHGDRGFELALERAASGELSVATREKVAREMRTLLDSNEGLQPRVLCGLPARGVTVRRFILPSAPSDEIRRLLTLQLESTFPLSPEELSWGYCTVSQNDGATLRTSTSETEAVVLALRREVLDDYSKLLADLGLRPTFVLGVWASSRLCDRRGEAYLLDIGRTHSELLRFRDGRPLDLRSLAFGGNTICRSISKALQVGTREAEELKLRWNGGTDPTTASDSSGASPALAESIREAVGLLVKELSAAWPGRHNNENSEGSGIDGPATLFLSGGTASLPEVAEEIRRGLGTSVTCRLLHEAEAPGCSSVTRALQLLEESNETNSSLSFLTPDTSPGRKPRRQAPATRLWLAATITLALISLLLPPLVKLWKLPGLKAQIALTQEIRNGMPALDEELNFLELVETSQAPYMEALAALARAAPKGTQIANLTANRAGDVSLQGSIGHFQQANDFRRRLMLAGPFSQVVLQELTPKVQKNKKKIWEFRLRASLAMTVEPERR